jgi:ATP-binding cassette, subfamily B (MDR/TAP), member 10
MLGFIGRPNSLRWYPCFEGAHICWGLNEPLALYRLRWQRFTDAKFLLCPFIYGNILLNPTDDIQTSIMRAIGAGTRIFDLLSREPAIPATAGVVLHPSRRGPIRFENVSFQYPSRQGVKILNDFNLEIEVGESVALV